MNFHDKTVLALTFGGYFKPLEKVFSAGKEKWGWTNRLVTTSSYIKPYKSFIDSLDDVFVLPSLLKQQSWESDPEEVDRINKIVSAAEKKTGLPISRLILSNERSIGRAYSKFSYRWPDDRVAKCVLKDPALANKILLRVFYFANKVVEKVSPDFSLGSAPGGIINGVFYFVLKYHGIPYIACRGGMLLPDRHFWTDDWESFNVSLESEFQKKLASGVSASLDSIKHCENFRKKPEPLPIYKKMWRKQSQDISFGKLSKDIIGAAKCRAASILKRDVVPNPKPVVPLIAFSYKKLLYSKLQNKFFQKYSDQELSTFKYIYYPFHLQPEMVLNVQAPAWYEQINIVKMLSYNLPSGYKLLVREHRYNVGRRRSAYLKEVLSFPGTVLIDAYDDQYKYIRNADLIVTIHGTTGFEGLMLRKPVITLDRTFYDDVGLAHSFLGCNDLGRMIMDVISQEKQSDNFDNRLALFLDAERDATIDDNVSVEHEVKYIQGLLDRYKDNCLQS